VLVVCSYCRRRIVDDPAAGDRVSHGMCPACAEHFEALWRGMSLGEYLDQLEDPVLVVNGDARVVAANARAARLLGRERGELAGLLEGEALACAHSRLPGGCGKTVHCRECTIRRGVERVAQTGVAVESASAYLETDAGRAELRISVHALDGLVKVVVEELKPPAGPGARR
jgi:PAS domain-containing protein